MFMDLMFFLAKAIIVLVCAAIIIRLLKKDTPSSKNKIIITHLNEELRKTCLHINKAILGKKFKKHKKEEAKIHKNQNANLLDRIFVLDFDGDVKAKAVSAFRNEVTALLQVANPTDEIVIRLKSPGGTVIGYGLGAAQMARIRNKGFNLTVCVDEVAASGGYMMACVGNKILSAPFAYIGSIGVILETLNFNKLLKSQHVEVEQITAGKYKRTISTLGPISEEGRQKAKDDVEDIHSHFKAHIQKFRPLLDIEKYATGEVWQGEQAQKIGLVDQIITSDEYLLSHIKTKNIFKAHTPKQTSVVDKICKGLKI